MTEVDENIWLLCWGAPTIWMARCWSLPVLTKLGRATKRHAQAQFLCGGRGAGDARAA